MKKILFCILTIIISMMISSCKKDTAVDPVQTDSQKITERLKAITDSVMNNSQISGIAAIVVDQSKGIDWRYATGYADIPAKRPLSLTNTFRIGSVTKTMVATIILQLIDEGKLSLDDKLSKFYPQLKNADIVTLTMLLNMTSGIFNYAADSVFNLNFTVSPLKVYKPQDLVDIAFRHDYNFTPGTMNEYSNTNYIILGMIIEKITGNSLESEINKRIVQKLGLTNTGLVSTGVTFPGENAKGYYFGPYIANDEYTNRLDISWAWAAGGVYSTPLDLLKYAQALVNGGLISNDLQQKRLVQYFTAEDPISSYGLGIKRFGMFYGHTGGLHGYQTNMYHCKVRNATVIILYNCTLYPHNPYELTAKFVDYLYGEKYYY